MIEKTEVKKAINGSAGEMAEFIQSNRIPIDATKLAELNESVKNQRSSKFEEFTEEAKKIRLKLREYLDTL